jgi:hypothetical protein
MHERDALRYWQGQGVTGNALIKKAVGVLANYTKGNKIRKREILALAVSLLKAKCHEDGIKWSEMALSEQRFIKSIGEMPSITRPEKPPDPVKPTPTAQELEKEHKKKELAEKLAEREEEIQKLKQQLDE